MKYSILVPVYNTEKYLRQCIESVLSQSFQDYELVLTDDGSTDNSAFICEEYAKKDCRIKFYKKDNEGLLLTRRHALKRAQGDYIFFLDSDDYWEKNLLSTIDSILTETPVDIVLYRYNCVDDEGRFLESKTGLLRDHSYFDNTNKTELLCSFLRTNLMNSMWTKCVRRSVIDTDADYSAFKDKKGEDLLQSISIMLNAESYLYLDAPLVNYRLSLNGRSRNYKIKYALDSLTVHSHVDNCLRACHSEELLFINHSRGFFLNVCQAILPSLPTVSTYMQYKDILTTIIKTSLFADIKRYSTLMKLTKKERVLLTLLDKRMLFVTYIIYKIRMYWA